jgi:protein required for attachment to host cells
MPTRIVVANQAGARFYDINRPSGALRLVGELANPEGRLHDRDLKSDRPGRVFDRAPTGRGRRGSVPHHATSTERRPRQQVASVFARRISAALATAHRTRGIDRIVLIAAPAFLGLLRKTLPKSLRAVVVAEVAKDLVNEAADGIRPHIPLRALRSLR